MAFNVIVFVNASGIPEAELHKVLTMGINKKRMKHKPRIKEIRMNGDFSFSQTKLSAHSCLGHLTIWFLGFRNDEDL